MKVKMGKFFCFLLKLLMFFLESKKFIKTFEDLVIFCELGRKHSASGENAQAEKLKRRGFGRGYRSVIEDFYVPSSVKNV